MSAIDYFKAARQPYASPTVSVIFLSQEQDVATLSSDTTLEDLEAISIFDDIF